MRPFEANEYADGWAACIAHKDRTANPYKPPFRGAWDRYRRDAWDKGWFHCNRNEPWIDPRKPSKHRGAAL